jgi:glycolate oxidase
VGSEGTLGIITEIILKISPKPLSHKTALGMFSSLHDAGQAVSAIMHSGIIPSVLEIMDANSIRVLREIASFPLPDVAAIILTETDGYTREETEYQMTRILEVFRENGVTEIQEAASVEDAEKLWRLRKSVGSAAAKLSTNNISEDVAIPISRLPELLTGISAIVAKHGLPFVIFGHAGDGNIHPRIMYNRSNADERRKVASVAEEIFQLSCSLGGTLTGEHGVGLAKAPFMALEHDKAAMELMRSLKKLIDPRNILNPGKMGLDNEVTTEQGAKS